MNSWIARIKSKLSRRLIVPIADGRDSWARFVTYDFVKALPAKAAAAMASPTTTPLDNNSVGALLQLDQAMETLAARVTPAIVNVTVTSRTKPNMTAGWRFRRHGSSLVALRSHVRTADAAPAAASG